MGNCLRRESLLSVHRWAGDEWEWEASRDEWEWEASRERDGGGTREGQKGNDDLSSSAGKKSQEVKIKITRKQLEELLGRVDVKELTVEQVLIYLMDARDRFEENQRSWRPVLQSIPE